MTNKLLSLYNYPPAIPPTLPSRPCRALPGCQNLTQAGKLEQAGLEAGTGREAGGPGCPAPWAAPLQQAGGFVCTSWRILNKNFVYFK